MSITIMHRLRLGDKGQKYSLEKTRRFERIRNHRTGNCWSIDEVSKRGKKSRKMLRSREI